MKNRAKRVKEEIQFSFTLLTVQFPSHSLLVVPLSLCRIPLIPFSFNLEYFKSVKTFQNKGKYTSMHIKANVYKLYCKTLRHKKNTFNNIVTTLLHTHIRAYVPRCALSRYTCMYVHKRPSYKSTNLVEYH